MGPRDDHQCDLNYKYSLGGKESMSLNSMQQQQLINQFAKLGASLATAQAQEEICSIFGLDFHVHIVSLCAVFRQFRWEFWRRRGIVNLALLMPVDCVASIETSSCTGAC